MAFAGARAVYFIGVAPPPRDSWRTEQNQDVPTTMILYKSCMRGSFVSIHLFCKKVK